MGKIEPYKGHHSKSTPRQLTDPLSSAPLRIDHSQRNEGLTTKVRHACAYAWHALQSCAERHWKGSRVLAHTGVSGGA